VTLPCEIHFPTLFVLSPAAAAICAARSGPPGIPGQVLSQLSDPHPQLLWLRPGRRFPALQFIDQ
jgi:hypothetical protein